jgi:pyruvate dehydrogenase E1 component beta subunit
MADRYFENARALANDGRGQTLAKWLVKKGDTVSSGDIIAEIETDKATMEFEAVDEGEITEILVEEGTENVKVGTVIAKISREDDGDEDDGDSKAKDNAKAATNDDEEDKKAPPSEPVHIPTPPAAAERASDPDIPEGTKMVSIAQREALRDAMAEEMRKDDRVFVMGEEVAEYQGAYKVTQGLLAGIGDPDA